MALDQDFWNRVNQRMAQEQQQQQEWAAQQQQAVDDTNPLVRGFLSGTAGVVEGQAQLGNLMGIGDGELAGYLKGVGERNARKKEYTIGDMIPFASDYWTNGEGVWYDTANLLGSSAALMGETAAVTTGLGAIGGVLGLGGAAATGGAAARGAAGIGGKILGAAERGASYAPKAVNAVTKGMAKSASKYGMKKFAKALEGPFGQMYALNVLKTPAEVASEMGNAGGDALAEGADIDEARKRALIVGAIQAPLLALSNTLESSNLGKVFAKEAGEEVAKKAGKEGFKKILENITVEGLQNAWEEGMQQSSQEYAAGNQSLAGVVNPFSWSEDARQQAAVGGVGGLVLGGGNAALGRIGGKKKASGNNNSNAANAGAGVNANGNATAGNSGGAGGGAATGGTVNGGVDSTNEQVESARDYLDNAYANADNEKDKEVIGAAADSDDPTVILNTAKRYGWAGIPANTEEAQEVKAKEAQAQAQAQAQTQALESAKAQAAQQVQEQQQAQQGIAQEPVAGDSPEAQQQTAVEAVNNKIAEMNGANAPEQNQTPAAAGNNNNIGQQPPRSGAAQNLPEVNTATASPAAQTGEAESAQINTRQKALAKQLARIDGKKNLVTSDGEINTTELRNSLPLKRFLNEAPDAVIIGRAALAGDKKAIAQFEKYGFSKQAAILDAIQNGLENYQLTDEDSAQIAKYDAAARKKAVTVLRDRIMKATYTKRMSQAERERLRRLTQNGSEAQLRAVARSLGISIPPLMDNTSAPEQIGTKQIVAGDTESSNENVSEAPALTEPKAGQSAPAQESSIPAQEPQAPAPASASQPAAEDTAPKASGKKAESQAQSKPAPQQANAASDGVPEKIKIGHSIMSPVVSDDGKTISFKPPQGTTYTNAESTDLKNAGFVYSAGVGMRAPNTQAAQNFLRSYAVDKATAPVSKAAAKKASKPKSESGENKKAPAKKATAKKATTKKKEASDNGKKGKESNNVGLDKRRVSEPEKTAADNAQQKARNASQDQKAEEVENEKNKKAVSAEENIANGKKASQKSPTSDDRRDVDTASGTSSAAGSDVSSNAIVSQETKAGSNQQPKKTRRQAQQALKTALDKIMEGARQAKLPQKIVSAWRSLLRARAIAYDPYDPTRMFEEHPLVVRNNTKDFVDYAQSAWHGSPYKFDKFDLGKIGAGEGNQMYGWGLYFAQDRKISEKYYRDRLAAQKKPEDIEEASALKITYKDGKTETVTRKDQFDFLADWTKADGTKSPITGNFVFLADYNMDIQSTLDYFSRQLRDCMRERADMISSEKSFPTAELKKVEAAIKEYQKMITFLKSVSSITAADDNITPSLYEVEIPDNDALLDREKALKDQPPKVREAIRELGLTGEEEELTGKQFYELAMQKYGSAKAASEALNSVGIKGITYVGGRDGRCYVVFDDKAVEIIETYNQRMNDALKGAFSARGNESVITFFEGKDATTVIHETGHYFMDMLEKIVKSGRATAQQIEDWNTMLKYGGMTQEEWDAADVKGRTGAHERWAEALETYLMEGKAPTEELKGVFARFKEWLLNVYKSAMGSLRNGNAIELTDDVRRVFDRMLTPAEREEMQTTRKMLEAVTTQENESSTAPQAVEASTKAEPTETKPATEKAKPFAVSEDVDDEYIQEIRRFEDEDNANEAKYNLSEESDIEPGKTRFETVREAFAKDFQNGNDEEFQKFGLTHGTEKNYYEWLADYYSDSNAQNIEQPAQESNASTSEANKEGSAEAEPQSSISKNNLGTSEEAVRDKLSEEQEGKKKPAKKESAPKQSPAPKAAVKKPEPDENGVVPIYANNHNGYFEGEELEKVREANTKAIMKAAQVIADKYDKGELPANEAKAQITALYKHYYSKAKVKPYTDDLQEQINELRKKITAKKQEAAQPGKKQKQQKAEEIKAEEEATEDIVTEAAKTIEGDPSEVEALDDKTREALNEALTEDELADLEGAATDSELDKDADAGRRELETVILVDFATDGKLSDGFNERLEKLEKYFADEDMPFESTKAAMQKYGRLLIRTLAAAEDTFVKAGGTTTRGYKAAIANNEEARRSHEEILNDMQDALPNGSFEQQDNGSYEISMPNGAKIGLNIKDRIIVNASEEVQAKASHGINQEENIVIEGSWEKLTGKMLSGFLNLSREGRKGTVFHEVFHAVWDLALTKREQAALLKYFTKIAKEQGRDVYEVMADAYADWELARRRERSSTFGKLWQKIKDFARRLRNAFTGMDNLHDIMQRIESGEVWERSSGLNYESEALRSNRYSVVKTDKSNTSNQRSNADPDVAVLRKKYKDKLDKAYARNASSSEITEIMNKYQEELVKLYEGKNLERKEKSRIRAAELRELRRAFKAGEINRYKVGGVTIYRDEAGKESVEDVNDDFAARTYVNRRREGKTFANATQKIDDTIHPAERKGLVQKGKDFVKNLYKNFYRNWVDKYVDLGIFDKAVAEAGVEVEGWNTVRNQTQYISNNVSGKVDALINGKEENLKVLSEQYGIKFEKSFAMIMDDLYKAATDMGKYLEENFPNAADKDEAAYRALSAYLVANRQLEGEKNHKLAYNEKVAKWELDGSKGAKPEYQEYKFEGGMTRAECQEVINAAPDAVKKAAIEYYKLNHKLLNIMVKTQTMSPELAAHLKDKWTKYCPMMRDFGDTEAVDAFVEGIRPGGKGIANVSIPIKNARSEGSARDVLNPLEMTVQSIANIIARGERNKAGLLLAERAKESGLTNFVKRVQGNSGDAKNCIFTLMENGKKVAYQTTPELFPAVTMGFEPSIKLQWAILTTPAKLLRAGATSSPSFIIRNLLRDTIFAAISSKNGFIPLVDSVKGAYALAHNAQRRAEFENSGVINSAFYGDAESIANALDEMAGGKFNPYNPIDIIKAAFRMFEKGSNFIEAATRMGEFIKAREKNKSIEQAAHEAIELTLNFNRSGIEGQQVNKIVPFFNACIQGGDKMYRLFRDDPAGTALKVGTYIVLPSLVLWAYNHDKDWWKEVDPRIRATNWILPGGIRIPKPQEVGYLFGTGVESILSAAYEQDPKAMGAWADAVKDALVPSFWPTAFLPLLEWNANYSFFLNKQVVNQAQQKLPDAMQYGNYTSEMSKYIGKQTDLSPLKIDNLIRSIFGTMGMAVWQTPDLFAAEKQNLPQKKLSEMAVVRDFIINDMNKNRTMTEFYELKAAAEKQHRAYGKTGSPKKEVQSVNAAARLISKNRMEIRDITNNSKLNPMRKRELIDKKEQEAKRIAQVCIKKYGKYFEY